MRCWASAVSSFSRASASRSIWLLCFFVRQTVLCLFFSSPVSYPLLVQLLVVFVPLNELLFFSFLSQKFIQPDFLFLEKKKKTELFWDPQQSFLIFVHHRHHFTCSKKAHQERQSAALPERQGSNWMPTECFVGVAARLVQALPCVDSWLPTSPTKT